VFDSVRPAGLGCREKSEMAEPMLQVPIAASVISGTELTARGVSNLDDLGNLAPALNVQNQQALSYVNIRGVGLQTTNPTTSSGVANYSDGFFIPHETAIADAYYDVGQIEVLRGPQGTLVGQNSTGGAIFVNSVRPSFDRLTGFLQQTFGDYGYTQTQGAVNVPVSDHLAIRIAENVYRKDSFYDDINVGGSALTAGLQPGDVASQSGRIAIKWQPNSDLDIYLKYESATRNGDGYVGKPYAELAGSNNRVDPRLSLSATFPVPTQPLMFRHREDTSRVARIRATAPISFSSPKRSMPTRAATRGASSAGS
jgi:iron complex outermembrane receptor protein